MAEDKKRTDPDNVFVTPGKKDASKVYVFVPFNYRDAQAALKEAGATWAGSQWGLDKTAFEGAEAKIREAARKDIALGTEGRKAREDALKAEAGEKPKASKKADKPELSDEEKEAAKQARAEANAKRRDEADKTRVPVVAGSVEAGAEIDVNGDTMVVTDLGSTWKLEDDAAVEALVKRFPHVEGLKVGDEVQFAKFEEPSPEPAGM